MISIHGFLTESLNREHNHNSEYLEVGSGVPVGRHHPLLHGANRSPASSNTARVTRTVAFLASRGKPNLHTEANSPHIHSFLLASRGKPTYRSQLTSHSLIPAKCEMVPWCQVRRPTCNVRWQPRPKCATQVLPSSSVCVPRTCTNCRRLYLRIPC